MTQEELHEEAQRKLQAMLKQGIRADEARHKVHEWMEQQKEEQHG